MKSITKELIIEKLAESLNITPSQYNDACAKFERFDNLCLPYYKCSCSFLSISLCRDMLWHCVF